MSDPLLVQLQSVTKVFRSTRVETYALSGVDLQVRRGEFVAVEGPSGSGKSTLLSLLALLDAPTRGTYLLDGCDAWRLGYLSRLRLRNMNIGIVFQNFNLIPDLTIVENVELPLRYRGVAARERRREALEALTHLGLSDRTSHYPGQLSGGQQQRAAVARAIVGKPSLLLADEPTGNLDSRSGDAVLDLLCSLHHSGHTICMATHNARYAAMADRRIALLDGSVCASAA